MADDNVTIAAKTIPWYGPSSGVELWVYSSKPWVTAAGTPINASSPYDGTKLQPYRKLACTINGGAHTCAIESKALSSTEDAIVNNDVTLIAVFMDTTYSTPRLINGYSVFGGTNSPSAFRVPDDPTSTTWADLASHFAGGPAPAPAYDVAINGDLSWTGTGTGDGSGIYDTDAAKLQGRDVTTAAPSNGQALAWDSAVSRWVPTSLGSLPSGGNATQLQSRAVSATLPTEGQALVFNSGAWQPGSVSMFFNVKAAPYNAVGDGVANDTTAINAAIAALNSAGGGVLYFPKGVYSVTGALTTITVPFRVVGEGSGSSPSAVAWVTKIVQTSRTANLFTVTADSGSFEGLYLFNSNSTFNGATVPATPPTAGAAIQVTAASSSQRVNLDDVVVEGFYDNVRQDGAHWALTRSHLINQVRYGLYVHNTINADVGDWSISDTHFSSKTYRADAFLRIEDAGGGKLQNVKMNSFDDPAVAGVQGYDYGISVEYTATSILLLNNVSIENYLTHAIHAVGISLFSFSNLQIADYVSAGTTPGILLDDCSYGKIDAVIRTNVATSEPGIKCVDCSHIAQGTIINFGYDGAFQFVTSYATDYTDLTLAAGWTNTGGTFKNAAYRYQNGQIRLRGLVSYGGGGTTTIATLPAHLWPSGDLIFPAVANGAFQRIRININGTIVQEGGGPTTLQSLEGIYYDHQ